MLRWPLFLGLRHCSHCFVMPIFGIKPELSIAHGLVSTCLTGAMRSCLFTSYQEGLNGGTSITLNT